MYTIVSNGSEAGDNGAPLWQELLVGGERWWPFDDQCEARTVGSSEMTSRMR